MLLREGADAQAANIFGETPLHMVAKSDPGFSAVAVALLDHGAKTDVLDKEGETPRDNAVNQWHENLIRIFDEHRAKV